MFLLTILSSDGKTPSRVTTLHVDTLTEAEINARPVIEKYFRGHDLVMVSNGDLTYNIYEVFEPIATVKLKIV